MNVIKLNLEGACTKTAGTGIIGVIGKNY